MNQFDLQVAYDQRGEKIGELMEELETAKSAYSDLLINSVREVRTLEVKRLDCKVFEAIGWTHVYCCNALDEGKDPRHIDCAEMLEKAKEQLQMPDPEAE